jgi:hypothetical protein
MDCACGHGLRVWTWTARVGMDCACGHGLRVWAWTARVDMDCACGHGLRVWTWTARVDMDCACGHGLRVWAWTARVDMDCACGHTHRISSHRISSCMLFLLRTKLNSEHEWLANRSDGELPSTVFKLVGTGHIPSTCDCTCTHETENGCACQRGSIQMQRIDTDRSSKRCNG